MYKPHARSVGSSLVTLAMVQCSKLLQILCFPRDVASSMVLAHAKQMFPSSFRCNAGATASESQR